MFRQYLCHKLTQNKTYPFGANTNWLERTSSVRTADFLAAAEPVRFKRIVKLRQGCLWKGRGRI